MIYIGFIPNLIDKFNTYMDRWVPVVCIIALIYIILQYTRKRINKEGFAKGFFLGALASIEALILGLIMDFIPKLASQYSQRFTSVSPATFRWILLYLIVVPFVYWMTRKNSGTRGVLSIFILLTTFLLGWWYERWVGMIFVSLPILLVFLHAINSVAQVIIPAANPEDKSERRQRRSAFLWYMLGLQYPFKVASKKASRDIVEQIPGDPTNDWGKPGVIWTWPHQVVGISKGIEFKKVAGPGTIFTDLFESPVALVDLRTHLRTTKIDAVTKDGMQIPAIVFMAFAIDKEKWPRANWTKGDYSRIKYLIGSNSDIDHLEGSYPYSSGRVRAAIDKVGINTSLQDGERPKLYWDDWIVKQVEEAAQEVLAERSLDELWRPRNDGLGMSALDEIAATLKELVAPRLAEIGVQLFGARIVNYKLDETDPITRQNIKTWSTYWEQQITEAEADAEAIYREEIEKAHAYSKSVLLDAIAESLKAARRINRDLPRHVIAQYYVHALEEYIKKQPGIDIDASKKRVEDLKGFLLYNRTETGE